jgi:hypothetical protein
MKTAILIPLALSASVCLSDKFLCITSLVRSSDICFTITTSFSGWTGFGIGSSTMDKADIYVGYANSTGGSTLVHLIGSGHDVNLVSNSLENVGSSSNTASQFSFCRPLQGLTESTDYIYAASNDKLSSPDTLTNDLPMHTERGSFGKVNFLLQDSKPTTTPESHSILKPTLNFTIQDVINLHGAMMWISWVLSPVVGIFIARFAKNALNHNWYM